MKLNSEELSILKYMILNELELMDQREELYEEDKEYIKNLKNILNKINKLEHNEKNKTI